MLMTAAFLFTSPALAQSFTFVPVNANATYLRTNEEYNSFNTVPLSLEALNIKAGDRIRLKRLGSFTYYSGCPGCNPPIPPDPENALFMIGVFSASDVLLPASQQNRVQDAIEAGLPSIITWSTLFGNLPTDQFGDFLIFTTVEVTVPVGAKYLFIAGLDDFYSDNADFDTDFAVLMTKLGNPEISNSELLDELSVALEQAAGGALIADEGAQSLSADAPEQAAGRALITDQAVLQNLRTKLLWAKQALNARGGTFITNNILLSFIYELEARRGAGVSEEAFEVLYYKAKYFINNRR
jgi:hypothetical protein